MADDEKTDPNAAVPGAAPTGSSNKYRDPGKSKIGKGLQDLLKQREEEKKKKPSPAPSPSPNAKAAEAAIKKAKAAKK